MYLFFLLKRAFNGVITEITLTYGNDILIKLEMLSIDIIIGNESGNSDVEGK